MLKIWTNILFILSDFLIENIFIIVSSLKNEICEEEEELRKMQSSSSETDSTESLSKGEY